MHCPTCRAIDSRVVDSRVAEEGAATRRRRECSSCHHRFTTYERVDHAQLSVKKSTGATESFDRSKVVAGLAVATKGRGVDIAMLDEMATRVEDALRLKGAEVSTAIIGLAVLDELRKIDDVSYLRFASVYKNFDAAADFHRELELMEKTAPVGAANG